jgi:hypothetical protein
VVTARFSTCKYRPIPAKPAFMDDPARPCAPERGRAYLFTSDDRGDQREAKKICLRRCPFQVECLRYALEQDERWHVWGGVLMSSGIERARARRSYHIDRQVRELWEKRLSDGQIGAALGINKRTVRENRHRQRLPALYGPGGKRKAEVAA